MSDIDENITAMVKTQKKYGRISDATKRIRAMSHMPGDPCNCKRFKCFETIKEKERDELLKQFNLMADYNKQMEHLTGLISVLRIKQRRPLVAIAFALTVSTD